MTLYIVIQSAIYRHSVGGVFTTLEAAKSCADHLAATDTDDHHIYEVLLVEGDTLIVEENAAVYVTQKGKTPKTSNDSMYPIV